MNKKEFKKYFDKIVPERDKWGKLCMDPRKFFLENISLKQTIVKNTFWITLAEGISRFLKLFLIIYIARILGATEYGKFAFALAFVSLFIVFSDFGLSQIITRDFAQEKKREKEFPAVLSLKFFLCLITLLLIFSSSFFITVDINIRQVIWILGLYFVVNSFSDIIYAFLRARQRMEYEALAKILQAVVVSSAGFFIIFNYPSIKNLSYSYLCASLFALIFILFLFHYKCFSFRIFFRKSIWQKFLKMSWPLALSGAFAIVYYSIDSVMMGYEGQIIETGWYNAAVRLSRVCLVPSILISQSFYPILSVAFKESKEKFQKVLNYWIEIMVFFAVPLMVGGVTLAPKIIDYIYGPSFVSSVLAFQILIISIAIILIGNIFGQTLIIANQQKSTFWIALWGAMFNIILNIILIPQFSLYGAAVATLTTFLLISLLFINSTIKFTSIKLLNSKIIHTGIIAVFSSIIMHFVIIQPQIYHLNVLLSVLVGVGVYLFYFLIFKKLIKFSRIGQKR